jgi:hypothetical protein
VTGSTALTQPLERVGRLPEAHDAGDRAQRPEDQDHVRVSQDPAGDPATNYLLAYAPERKVCVPGTASATSGAGDRWPTSVAPAWIWMSRVMPADLWPGRVQ